MKSKVEQYAKGDFYVEYPDIKLSRNYLQLKIEAGSVYTGSIDVTSENDIPMKMMVYDDAYLLCLESHSIIGRKAAVKFTFDAVGKKRGDVFEGILHLVGNGKEYTVAYNIEIVAPFIDVKGLAIDDLMKFSAVAKNDWEHGLSIFYSEKFRHSLIADNEEYLSAYDTLLKSPDKDRALEEFLVYTHKKRALTLQAAHDRFQFSYPKMREEHVLNFTKTTWGYCKMRVYTDCRFIELPTDEICSMDFDSQECTFTYAINPEMLDGDGAVTGHIYFENTYQKITVNILIKKPEDNIKTLHRNNDKRLVKHEIAELVHGYLEYRTGNLTIEEYVEGGKNALNHLLELEPEKGLYRLGLLHMMILAGRNENAAQEIRRMEADNDKAISGTLENCYYMYLKAILTREMKMIVRASESIEQALAKDGEHKLFCFWMLLNIDERYQKDSEFRFNQIDNMYMAGLDSPVLALEVCDIINNEPLLIKKLGDTELAAIRFGLRHEFLSPEAKDEFIQLSGRERDFNPKVFSILKKIYNEEKRPDIIQVMCGLLVRGGKLDEAYHDIYLDGIKSGYKLVGIQENYLRSMKKDEYEIIPETVLRYFNYKSVLSDKEYAFLYANVITNKRKYGGQYEDYLPNIEAFMQRQIIKGNISDDLMVIYGELLRPQAVADNFASSLVNVIFKRKLTVANDNIVAVEVSHSELSEAFRVPVTSRVAYIDVVTESAAVTLIDRDGNRYISTIPYQLQKLVDETLYLEMLSRYSVDDYRYALYLYDTSGACDPSDAGELNIARDLLSFEEISDITKQKAIFGIIKYYSKHIDKDILRSYLDRLDIASVEPKEGQEYAANLIRAGLFDKAYEAVKRFGFESVDNDLLIKLVETLKDLPVYAKEEMLIAIAVYLYRMGQETPEILGYLVDYYRSGLSNMIKLWKRAENRISRTELLEENILCEAMYVESWDKDVYRIFSAFIAKRNHGMVIKAFFKRAAFAYLIEDATLPEDFFKDLMNKLTDEELTDDICSASLLRFLSQKQRLTPDEEKWAVAELESFVKRGIILPYFRSFKKIYTLPKDLYLMTYVVTRSKAGLNISFKYAVSKGNGGEECNKTARMIEVLPGYYVAEFVLFHGENLIYEMEEPYDRFAAIYESKGMKQKGETQEYENRFEMLNSMLESQETGDNQILIDKIDRYLKLSTLFEENLKIM